MRMYRNEIILSLKKTYYFIVACFSFDASLIVAIDCHRNGYVFWQSECQWEIKYYKIMYTLLGFAGIDGTTITLLSNIYIYYYSKRGLRGYGRSHAQIDF